MCENKNTCENCVSDILKVILILQEEACPDNCLNSCDKPALGGGPNCLVCNTRPIMLYTCCGNGTPRSMPVSKTETDTTSSVFRIEKLDGCCATFRVLKTDSQETNNYVATDSFFTMDLSCCCVIRCLNDTYIECV